jgi:septin family protein
VPFAVVGSNTIFEYPHGPEMKRTRGRKYPWGVVDIEDEEHCDFVALRTILIRYPVHDFGGKFELSRFLTWNRF